MEMSKIAMKAPSRDPITAIHCLKVAFAKVFSVIERSPWPRRKDPKQSGLHNPEPIQA